MKSLLLAVFLLLIGMNVLAEEEKLTITTYYPSPIGIYQELQANKLAVGDFDRSGKLDEGDLPASGNDMNVAGNLTVGSQAANTVRLTVNGQIRACDSAGQCGILQIDCDASNNCWAVYSD